LELLPPCTSGMQGSDIQIPQCTRVVGKPWNQRVVPQPIGRPLPMQSLLCPQDEGVPNIRLCRAIPPTLPGPIPVNKGSFARIDKKMMSTLGAMTPAKQQRVLTLVPRKLSDEAICPGGPAFLTSPCHAWILPEGNEQHVPRAVPPTQDQPRGVTSGEQRVGPTQEIILIKDLRQMSDASPIMNVPNPTTKRTLKLTKRVHRRLTRDNIPRTIPPIT
jgi:hypothetical protein